MNIALRRVMTVDDYLDWAAAQSEEPRTELINGQIVPMSPERVAHNRIKGAVFIALRRAMDEARIAGEVFTDGVAIPIDVYTAYEPDASVRCGAPVPGDAMKITDPVIAELRSFGHQRETHRLFQGRQRAPLSGHRS